MSVPQQQALGHSVNVAVWLFRAMVIFRVTDHAPEFRSYSSALFRSLQGAPQKRGTRKDIRFPPPPVFVCLCRTSQFAESCALNANEMTEVRSLLLRRRACVFGADTVF